MRSLGHLCYRHLVLYRMFGVWWPEALWFLLVVLVLLVREVEEKGAVTRMDRAGQC